MKRPDTRADSMEAALGELSELRAKLGALEERVATALTRLDQHSEHVERSARQSTELEVEVQRARDGATLTRQEVLRLTEASVALREQLTELAGRIERLGTQVQRVERVERAAEETKRQFADQLRQAVEQLRAELSAQAKHGVSERERMRRDLDALDTRLEGLTELETRLSARAAEAKRLAAQLGDVQSTLERRVDEWRRTQDRLTRLEDSLNKVAGALGELEASAPPRDEYERRTSERLEQIGSTLEHLNQDMARLATVEQRFGDLETMIRERDRQTEVRQEHIRAAWQAELADHRRELATWRAEFEALRQDHQLALDLLKQVRQLGHELERNQQQADERLRLAIERQAQAIREAASEQDLRWDLFIKQRTHEWAELTRRLDLGDQGLLSLRESAERAERRLAGVDADLAQHAQRLDEADLRHARLQAQTLRGLIDTLGGRLSEVEALLPSEEQRDHRRSERETLRRTLRSRRPSAGQ